MLLDGLDGHDVISTTESTSAAGRTGVGWPGGITVGPRQQRLRARSLLAGCSGPDGWTMDNGPWRGGRACAG